MGRRSINTTKSGKFMNPTDQARKEARKKELKKNRRQRQMVRAAVLKGKDPHQLISEMEKIDEMEYDVNNPPQLNEKVLKDKRKKLRDTFHRILRLYEKEDREQWIELKKIEHEYECQRNKMIQYFESVKHAEQVKLEEIPLPLLPGEELGASKIPLPDGIPLPNLFSQPHSILKKVIGSEHGALYKGNKIPPGVPPGPPPPLSDDESEDRHIDSSNGKSKKIRFQDDNNDKTSDDTSKGLTKQSQSGGPDEINEFLKEMESVHKQKKESGEEPMDTSQSGKRSDKNFGGPTQQNSMRPSLMPPGPPPGQPPAHMLYNRPPPTAGRPMGMPSGPPNRLLPPGPPPGPPPGMPPRLGGPPVRLPPGPPPGLPPRMMRPNMMSSQVGPPPPPMSQSSNTNVLSAPPSLISRPPVKQSSQYGGKKSEADDKKSSGATIEAKPQLRHLNTDVTKFMPTSLRVKREDKIVKKKDPLLMPLGLRHDDTNMFMPKKLRQPSSVKGPTKDDAYDQFMKEMTGLL